MSDKKHKLQKTSLPEALNTLIKDHCVFAPAGEAERLAFTPINAENTQDVNLTGLSVLPPKELIFPRSETLYSVDLGTGDVTQPEEAKKTVIFGIRPCDARGIVNLDNAFLEKTYVDGAYADKREKLTIVTLACQEIPDRACFCDSMGGGPHDAEGSDLLMTDTKDGEAWLVSAHTDKGKAVEELWKAAGLLDDAGKTAAVKPPSCTLKVDKPKDLAKKLANAFEDPAWAGFSEACIGCGACSYICPTCYCFDMDMEKRGEASQFRCWDCCMFSDYSRMAGGHNPRPTKKERLRNRYMHKLSYFDERYGRTLCVGCGRCLAKCPAGLDIVSVIEWGGTL